MEPCTGPYRRVSETVAARWQRNQLFSNLSRNHEMNDPHVVALTYRLETEGGVHFDADTPAVTHETEEFSVELSDGRAVFLMKEPFASETETRQLTDPFVRAWEISYALARGIGEVDFVFDSGPASADGR